MKRNWLWAVIAAFAALGFASCASVPSVQAWKPWQRTLSSGNTINPNSSIRIEVHGTTEPLLGNEGLLAQRIGESLSILMARRGFVIKDTGAGLTVSLEYLTTRQDRASMQTRTVSYSELGQALGVKMALAIGMTSTEVSHAQEYQHSLAVQITSREGQLLWKGESAWDSPDTDILPDLVPALQLMLSDLPFDSTYVPSIPEVAADRAMDYYRITCLNRTYACPALPNRIIFPKLAKPSPGRTVFMDEEEGPMPMSSYDYIALAAYNDLVQTAEYALPRGEDWKDPLKAALWSKVTLGGRYLLGSEKKLIKVLVTLKGKRDGYDVDKCWIATDEEYAKFQERLTNWRQRLVEYFSVYRQ